MTMMELAQNPREVAAAEAAQARGAAEAVAQTARNEAEQARDIARAQREAAEAQRDAARAQREAAQAQGGDGGTGVVTITKDGVTTVLNDASPEAVATALGMPRNESDGGYVVAGLGIVSTALVLIVALLLRYRGKSRGTAKVPELNDDLMQRLSRMEAGIESVAVEVERISEGQRFTTRLLADRPIEEVRRG